MEHCGFDFSNLTKLKSLALRGTHPDDSQVDVFIYILDSLKAPELREFTLTLIHDNRFTALKRIDNRLSEKFKNLERLIVEYVNLQEVELEEAQEEIQNLFPQMGSRNMLTVRSYVNPFRY